MIYMYVYIILPGLSIGCAVVVVLLVSPVVFWAFNTAIWKAANIAKEENNILFFLRKKETIVKRKSYKLAKYKKYPGAFICKKGKMINNWAPWKMFIPYY